MERAFGATLRELRQSAGLSQERLGLEIGSGRTYISQLERGERGASLRMVFRLAARLDLPAAEIVSRAERIMQQS